MKKFFIFMAILATMTSSCKKKSQTIQFPRIIQIKGIAQNPEGIEFDKRDQTFLLSSLNAAPIIKVFRDGTYKKFTSGEKFPLSTAGLQIDEKRNRLLAASFNGMELMDKNPKTKGTAHLRIYNLKTGVLQKDINLSSLAPKAKAYFANDIAVDAQGNVYISDWYANLIYKVDAKGQASIFWKNQTKISGSPNGLDFHPKGYLLVSLLKVNKKGLYSNFGLVKIPINAPHSATQVKISHPKFSGFDGMVINNKGNIIGISNDRKSPGGNILVELTSKNDWKSANVINVKSINPSTTLAITPNEQYFVIHQDFSNNFAKNWKIERIQFQ